MDQSAASRVDETAAFLRARGVAGGFDAALVLGTGLGSLADEVEEPVPVPYTQIPHFPRSAVSGHAGRLVAGRLEGRRVLLFQGRAHYYETGDAAAMRVPVALAKAFDVPALILTNAAGSLRPQIRPVQIVAISDHLNLSGMNPLIGDHSDERFV